ncbi:type II secretion system protein GspL [Parasedimentitalea marina]|nr:type II secretion system protein GspL [Parasedimentitalea marina]
MSAAPTSRPSKAAPDFILLGGPLAASHQVVLVPGEMVPLYSLDLPASLRSGIREKVARRQLADRLGFAPALRPFVPTIQGHPKANTKNWTRVFTADPAWLESLSTLSGRAVLPDYLSLPTATDLWTLACTAEDRVQARLGPSDGFSAHLTLTPLLLEQALDSGPPPRAILVMNEVGPAIRALAESRNIPILETLFDAEALKIVPRVLAHGELACDLRKNPIASQVQMARRVLPWRWPLLAAALAAALWAAAQQIAIQRSETHTQALRAKTQELVQQHFTQGGPVLDPRLQVSRVLAELQRANGSSTHQTSPLELARRAGAIITAADAKPEMLTYREGQGLSVILRLPDFAAAERLAAAFAAEGLDARLTESGTASDSDGVRAEFTIATQAEDTE